ncbi:MalY/PatB family protein [Paenibacillus eucommiae]|uniref:cysteine-S-conjugate beta-lyase n=1 Tax=Paenibacillus eucommiae TaxID=1355755 RepID=A0ABS4ITU5_9BACL|nr:MalY/PatB family protein [Paenibacillus eucommiae]MBP1991002.1 cystathionine beta-lyase [Paenibacillus eucommiae]
MSEKTFDFDKVIDRRGTYSYKWDQSEKLFGDKDILPLWVADMDFSSPPAVAEAIAKRAAQGIYGYTVKTAAYTDAITGWFKRRHQWEISPEWLTDSPGIVPSLSIAVDLFSEPGSKVILQSPVYYPFYDVIRMNGRQVADNALLLNDSYYTMDLGHLEELMQDGAKLLLLCNPHNPGGRVWKREELVSVGELCQKYNVTVVSDEIHCDLIHKGHQHIPFASISDEFAQMSLTCLAPTKTFNLPGIPVSFVVTPNARLKKKFDFKLKTLSLHMLNFFAPVAVEASYNQGEEWLEQMLDYVGDNADYALSYLSEHLPQLQAMRPEGTYLLWVDCRKLNLDAAGIKALMYEKGKVAFNEGSIFGAGGQGFVRINLACPRSILQEALERFHRGFL